MANTEKSAMDISEEAVKRVDSTGSPGQASITDHCLQKTLKDRHLSMIALGGALGTGLLVGT